MATGGLDRISLRPLPRSESEQVVAGEGRPGPGLRWAEDYPTSDTVVALRMLAAAYEALGLPVGDQPSWWLHQVVAGSPSGAVVVGDIGFHGPPDEDGVVELGYCVAPSWRRRGVATAACGQLVERAWTLGAHRLVAEAAADNPASRAVLRAAGFVPTDGDRFVRERP